MTKEERAEELDRRNSAMWEQYLQYKSLSPKVVCVQWGLSVKGYQTAIQTMKKRMK